MFFLKELYSNSPTIQEVNDDFRNVAADVQLFSLFDPKSMSFGGLKDIMIVKRASAIMGLPGDVLLILLVITVGYASLIHLWILVTQL